MKKIRIDSILMVIAIVLIFSYIAYEAYTVTHIDLKTETAVISTVYDKVEATALVIRDEHTIDRADSGITVPCLADGDKINVGGNVAMTFSSQEAAFGYSKYNELQSQLAYYEALEAQTLGQSASVESINAEINTSIDSYIRTVYGGKTAAVQAAGDKVNDGILRRQMLIGESVDLLSIIQELRAQSEQYAATANPDSFITTDVSGVFSGYTDGFETLIDYDKAEELTEQQVLDAIETVKSTKQKDSNYLGKLITSYAWYLECVVKTEDIKNLKNGSRVQIALKDSDDTVITVQIVSGAETQLGQETTVLVMKCSNLDSQLSSLRAEDIEIRVKSYEGIKVPASAMHVSGDKKGVYALISSQVHFREAEVIYSADDYVLLKFDADNPNGIRLYDQIITQGKGLEDGKVFT